jgi:hypothetical protein
MRAHEVRRARHQAEEFDVAHAPPVVLVEGRVQHREQHRGIGLRHDRDPPAGGGGGHRHVGLELDPLSPPPPRLRVTPDADDPAADVAVVPEGQDVARVRHVGGHRERAMPELAVEVLRVRALHPLPAADPLIQGSPREEERREGPEVRRRDPAGADGDGQPGIAVVVHQPLRADGLELPGEEVQRLVPADLDPSRILVLALPGIGALHRRLDPVGVVELLDQAVRPHARAPARRVLFLEVEVRLDLDGDAVLHHDVQEVGAGHALVAVRRHLPRLRHAASSTR